jgi:glucosamine-6-phosphate isomerase
MTIFKAGSYGELSKQAAKDLLQFAVNNPAPLICTASGDSPAGLYRELVQGTVTGSLDISHWNFVGLDEWAGMNGNDEGSCRYHLDKQFFHPLLVKEEKICFFDGRAEDKTAECEATENYIKQHNGIDVAIVGLGLNGHIGMNEPGSPAGSRSRVADIALQTQQVGQKYFSASQSLTHGLTLGIATLLEAKYIMLIVNGAHKASVVHRMLNEEVSEQLPATLFRDHPGLYIYLDSTAAQLV